jgi:CRP-like cAMP-binding protein
MIAIKHQDEGSKQYKSRGFLNGLTLFAGLSTKDIELFSDAAHIRKYKKGQVIYIEGEKAELFYVVCSGWVRLFHTAEDGEEANLAILPENSIVGESSIFERGCYASTADVVEPAQILSIPLQLLKDQLRVNHLLAFNMLNSLIQYQRRYEQQLQQYLHYSAPQRIGCFLLGLCPVPQQKDGVKFNLPYEKALIASTLGMRGPTFSRALNILREETGVRISGTQVTIDSIKRMLDFVNGCYTKPHLG